MDNMTFLQNFFDEHGDTNEKDKLFYDGSITDHSFDLFLANNSDTNEDDGSNCLQHYVFEESSGGTALFGETHADTEMEVFLNGILGTSSNTSECIEQSMENKTSELKSQLKPCTPVRSDDKRSASTSRQNKRKRERDEGKKMQNGSREAPKTGYWFFIQENKSNYKNLPFFDVTKLLGHQWSNMDERQKKVYLDKAEDAKKRAKEQADASYKFNERPKKSKIMNNEGSPIFNGDSNSDVEEKDNDEELYCNVCDQRFKNRHNKNKHLTGRLHLSKYKSQLSRDDGSSKSAGNEPDSFNTASNITVNTSQPSRVTTLEASMFDLKRILADRNSDLNYWRNQLELAEKENKRLRITVEYFSRRAIELSQQLLDKIREKNCACSRRC